MTEHPVVSEKEWLDASRALLAEEKELTHRRDALAAKRRALPWVKVEKDYRFDTPDGSVSLADLFEGRSQLLVYHFMFGADWEEGCKSCSFWADHFSATRIHLAHRDTAIALVSTAPIARLDAYRKRMGWDVRWVSAGTSGFNVDFCVSAPPGTNKILYNFGTEVWEFGEKQGISAFRRKDGAIYRTYSTFSRGIDLMNTTYQLLDITSKGRDEDGLDFPMSWVRRHDQY